MSQEQKAMKPAPAPADREPNSEHCPVAQPAYTAFGEVSPPTSITYFVEEQPRLFNFVHDQAKGLCILTKADGSLEHFRDKPTRYLVVEADSRTGKLMPTVKGDEPVYLYLCREEREQRELR
jgi:hypothetical protein